MRILFLTQRVPYPPNRGDRILNYHYIRHLAREHDVVVGCLSEGADDSESIAALREMTSDVVSVPVSRMGCRWRALKALMGGKRPLTLAYFDEPEFRSRIRQLLRDSRFDLAIASSSSMATFIDDVEIPRIIQFVDLDSQKWSSYSQESRFPRSWVYGQEARRLLDYEQSVARRFDCSLFCSTREQQDFQRLVPGSSARVIRNGVDLEYFQPPRERRPDSLNLVFTGVMNYRPNSEGAGWFCADVFPIVRQTVPEATFTICGASPDATVQRLARIPGVTVTGAVPDVRPYLNSASVAVIPVRIARGIQNKLLEAMATGLPAVTTTAAFAGLQADLGDSVQVSDDPAGFARHVIDFLRDEPRRMKAGREARDIVESRFRWENSLAELDDVIADVMARRTPAREPVIA